MVAGAALMMAVGSVASAGTINIWTTNARRTSNGGEFVAWNAQGLSYNGLPLVSNLATDAAVQASSGKAGAFGTFCIEVSEHISGDQQYGAQLSDRAYKGSVGPQGDVLDYQTKWLYWNYRNNTLMSEVAGADFVNGTNAQMQAMTRALQLAIWSFEEPGQGTNTLANQMISAANAAYADFLLGNGQSGVHRVVAINLGSAQDGWKYQDQLGIVVPLPTAGGMSMAGLALVFAFRRRIRM
jgi:hypothetical protein